MRENWGKFGIYDSEEEAKSAAKEKCSNWNIVGFSGGEDYYQLPAHTVPVSQGGTNSTIEEYVDPRIKAFEDSYSDYLPESYVDGQSNEFKKADSLESNDFATGRKVVDNYVELTTKSDAIVLKDAEINMHIDGNIWFETLYLDNYNIDGKLDYSSELRSSWNTSNII